MRGVAAVRDMCRGIKVREAINATKTVRERYATTRTRDEPEKRETSKCSGLRAVEEPRTRDS